MDKISYETKPIEYLEDVALQVLAEEREKIQSIARLVSRFRDDRVERGEVRKVPAWNLAKEKEAFRRRLFGGA